MSLLFAFPDTNVFLHYSPLETIDWCDLLKAEKAVLVIAPIVIRELNRRKDTPGSAKMRARAASALKTLDGLLDSESAPKIRDSVELWFRDKDPSIDFPSHSLVREVSDDQLLAAIIEFQNENPGSSIVLVTADLGLKVKSRAHGIKTLRLPEALKLPDELDDDRKRIIQLQEENRQFRLQIPELKVLFDTDEDRLRVPLSVSPEQTSDDFTRRMEEIRRTYPKLKGTENFNFGFLGVSLDSISRYNAHLDEFYVKWETHLKAHLEFSLLKQRVVMVTTKLVNTGNCPADDIDMFMHFPDGFELLSEKDFPKSPEPPKPPARPRTSYDELFANLNATVRFPSNLSKAMAGASMHAPRPPKNVTGFRIRRTSSYEVYEKIKRVKHAFEEHLDLLYVVFPSLEEARSFTIDYEIHAANLPKTTAGQLHVIIERDGSRPVP